jgi:hypothetical protein
MTLIKWLLKPTCMLKYYFFFEVFFVVYKKYNMILALRDLAACMKANIYIYIYIYIYFENRYFNTGFISLRYKNTDRY